MKLKIVTVKTRDYTRVIAMASSSDAGVSETLGSLDVLPRSGMHMAPVGPAWKDVQPEVRDMLMEELDRIRSCEFATRKDEISSQAKRNARKKVRK